MIRVTSDCSRWNIYQHRQARGLPQPERRDGPWERFEDELFERFYAGDLETVPEAKQDPRLAAWSKQVWTATEQVPDFARLVEECQGKVELAATAAEQIGAQLRGLAPKPQDDEQGGDDMSLGAMSEDSAVYLRKLRRALRGAVKRAQDGVEEAREAAEAFSGVGGWTPGDNDGVSGRSSRYRNLSDRLRQDGRLQRIALLAGRMKRIAAQKQKAKVQVGADELCDVEQGANIPRLLPTELMLLRHPKLKTLLFKKLLERQAMQYQLSGIEERGKGPIVVCLDKSGSMDGAPDIWATAVALALLDVAIRQKRAFAILSFDHTILYERVVNVGELLPSDALFVPVHGGTNINRAMDRAIGIVASNQGTMKKADIVLITDGGSDDEDAPALRARAKDLGITCLGIGIGVVPGVLRPWCDEVVAYNGSLDTVEGAAAEALFSGI